MAMIASAAAHMVLSLVSTKPVESERRFQPIVLVLAALVAVTGLAVLTFGWLGGVEQLVRVRATYPAMVPETAILVVLGAIGVILNQFPNGRGVTVLVSFLIVVVVFSGHLYPIVATRFAGRDELSPATMIMGLLVAMALILGGAKNAQLRFLGFLLTSYGLALVSIPLLGYALNTQVLFGNSLFVSTSILTAICFAALFLALLLTDSGLNWNRIILDEEDRSQHRRRMLLPLVLIPVSMVATTIYAWKGGSDVSVELTALTVCCIFSVAISTIYFTNSTKISDRRAAEMMAVLRETERARQAAELALNRAQKVEALGNLVGGVAHDFNNSLTVILGNLELIEGEGDRERRNSYVQEAIDASNHAANLTRQLLAYGRKSRLEPLPNNLDDMVVDTLRMFRRICPEDIAIHSNFEASRAIALLDSANFSQSLLNVLINARDALPDGGEIFVSTRTGFLPEAALVEFNDAEPLAPGTYVKLVVRDTGIGMSARTLARAEEPFFTTKPVGEGTGLGLSAVSGFCRQSGGGLRLESEEGVGTTVTMAFPKIGDFNSETDSFETIAAPADISPFRVLIVDDEPSVARVMARQLSLDGHVVRMAENAQQALSILEVEPLPQLVISDLVMPGPVQGHKLAEVIRQRYPQVRVLLMSGYESERRRAAITTVKELHFLQKPVSRATLRLAVAKAMDAA